MMETPTELELEVGSAVMMALASILVPAIIVGLAMALDRIADRIIKHSKKK